ncbi:MAG: hypothetical protein ACI87W_001497 [Halieaceae bacterium]|jgi:hypothetical protein
MVQGNSWQRLNRQDPLSLERQLADEYLAPRHRVCLEVLNTYAGTQDVYTLIPGHTQTDIPGF